MFRSFRNINPGFKCLGFFCCSGRRAVPNLNKEPCRFGCCEGLSVGKRLGTCFSLRVWVPKLDWKLILSTSVPEPAPEVSVGWNILKELRRLSALLEILQENELLELLLSLMVPQSLGHLPRNLKVFGVVLATRSSGISRVTEQYLHHRAAGWYRTMWHILLWLNLGPLCWPATQRSKSGRNTIFSDLLVRMLKTWDDFRKFLGCGVFFFFYPWTNALMPFWASGFDLGTFIILDTLIKSCFKCLHTLLQKISVEVGSVP